MVFGIRLWVEIQMLKKWIWNLAISLDQLVNTILGGDPDETLCSRAAKAKRENKLWGRLLCKIMDYFDKGHCENSIEKDEGSNAVGR